MSEQTPNSPEGLRGAEPSMEDILASIRKIISDDEPVAMESPEDIPAVDLVEAPKGDALDDLMQGIHMDSNDLTSDAVLDAEQADAASFAAEGDSVDLNIDDVLAGLDDDILGSELNDVPAVELEPHIPDDALSAVSETVEAESFDLDSLMETPDAVESEFLSLDIAPDADEDILAFLDADIPLASEPTASFTDALPVAAAGVLPVLAAVKMAVPEPEKITADDVEMDALLDDILMTPPESEDIVQAEDVFDTDDVFQSEAYDTDLSEADVSTDPVSHDEMSDLELVKSLMADLADDPEVFESEEDLEALLAIPEAEPESDVDELMSTLGDEQEVVAGSDVEKEDDVLGDILDMTLEDELQSHPDDIEVPDDIEMMDAQTDDLTSLDEVLEAEQNNIAENALDVEDLPTTDVQADDFPSLSEIAAAAEADAVAVETVIAPQAIVATAGLAATVGGAALGATAFGATADETTEFGKALAETETTETYTETTHKITSQETSMPVHAVNSDAILDEVTESAAAGAFAQLNTVVEDKATFNERGPRIGDLVQDALRPMLKEWLDANLKGIVERAVTKEVKRISSGK